MLGIVGGQKANHALHRVQVKLGGFATVRGGCNEFTPSTHCDTSIIITTHACSLFSEVKPLLEIASIEGPHEARAVAIDALSMCCYVGANDDLVTREMMEKMQILWRKGGCGHQGDDGEDADCVEGV